MLLQKILLCLWFFKRGIKVSKGIVMEIKNSGHLVGCVLVYSITVCKTSKNEAKQALPFAMKANHRH